MNTAPRVYIEGTTWTPSRFVSMTMFSLHWISTGRTLLGAIAMSFLVQKIKFSNLKSSEIYDPLSINPADPLRVLFWFYGCWTLDMSSNATGLTDPLIPARVSTWKITFRKNYGVTSICTTQSGQQLTACEDIWMCFSTSVRCCPGTTGTTGASFSAVKEFFKVFLRTERSPPREENG